MNIYELDEEEQYQFTELFYDHAHIHICAEDEKHSPCPWSCPWLHGIRYTICADTIEHLVNLYVDGVIDTIIEDIEEHNRNVGDL